MVDFDPRPALDQLAAEYSKRAEAIRRDLGRSHSPDFAEQAQQRQNDDVLRALLAEAEAGMRLADGTYGECARCGEAIEERRLRALPAAEHCLRCADAVD